MPDNFICSSGKNAIRFTPGEDVAAGHFYITGTSVIGFPVIDVTTDSIEMLFYSADITETTIKKSTETWVAGNKLYYDATLNEVTLDDNSGANLCVGVAYEACAADVTTAYYVLNGIN